jgi:phosphoribosyl 1,2-cyclic phosphodiesterase
VLSFSLLGSGSGGNAILICSGSSKILIDNGLSYRQLVLRSAEAGFDLDGLAGVFVTHEHIDHVGGLGTLCRRHQVPVFLTEGTLNALPVKVGALPRVEVFEAGETVAVDGMAVSSFSVSHDASDPVSYTVTAGGARLGLASDLGKPSQLVRTRLAGSHALVLESNYCPDLLRRGAYPPAVQQRIRGTMGHLSNQDMCTLLSELRHDALRTVVLVHLSEENNDHTLARTMAERVLAGHGARVLVARQDGPTERIEVTA